VPVAEPAPVAEPVPIGDAAPGIVPAVFSVMPGRALVGPAALSASAGASRAVLPLQPLAAHSAQSKMTERWGRWARCTTGKWQRCETSVGTKRSGAAARCDLLASE
jgi:hypothetical protein